MNTRSQIFGLRWLATSKCPDVTFQAPGHLHYFACL